MRVRGKEFFKKFNFGGRERADEVEDYGCDVALRARSRGLL